MTTKRLLLAALVLGAIAFAGWHLRSKTQNSPATDNPVTAEDTATEQNAPPPNATIVPDRPRFVISSGAPSAAEADLPLRAAASSLRNYRAAFGQNPTGTNAEITRVLSGKNSRSANYLPAGAQIDDKGQLTDRWGQPLFFHQISGALMEIRSAGPDHRMWNADDEVLR